MCSCHLSPLSAIIHTIRATHSQLHTLPNSYKMVRPPHLCSHLLTHRRLMVLLLQVSCPAPLLPRSAFSSQVPACPTRNVTGNVMPLAEATTQVSFLEFLQRCGVLIAPPQPSQLPVPISPLDAAVQTTPPCDACQDVSTQTSDQQVSSISFDVAVQTSFHGVHISSLDAAVQTTPHKVLRLSTSLHSWVLAQFPRFLLIFLFRLPYAVWCHTMLPYNYRSRSSLLAVFYRTILWTAKTLFVSPRHQCKVHVPCCSHRQDSNSSPRLLVPVLVLTCTLHMAHLLQLHLCVHSPPLAPPMWEHNMHDRLLLVREVPEPLLREPTILSIQILVQGLALFLNRVPSFFLWSTLVNPNLKGTMVSIQLTATSRIINIVFPFYNGIQARRAEILPT